MNSFILSRPAFSWAIQLIINFHFQTFIPEILILIFLWYRLSQGFDELSFSFSVLFRSEIIRTCVFFILLLTELPLNLHFLLSGYCMRITACLVFVCSHLWYYLFHLIPLLLCVHFPEWWTSVHSEQLRASSWCKEWNRSLHDFGCKLWKSSEEDFQVPILPDPEPSWSNLDMRVMGSTFCYFFAQLKWRASR